MSAAASGTDVIVAEALEVVSEMPPARVRVTGDGPLASALISRLGSVSDAGEAPGGPPLAIIETTGRSETLSAACAEVSSGGTVVLAADEAERVDIDLYREVHRRGLVLVGVPDPEDLPSGSKASPSDLAR